MDNEKNFVILLIVFITAMALSGLVCSLFSKCKDSIINKDRKKKKQVDNKEIIESNEWARKKFLPIYLIICDVYFNGHSFTGKEAEEIINNLKDINRKWDNMFSYYHPNWYYSYFVHLYRLFELQGLAGIEDEHAEEAYSLAKKIYDAIEIILKLGDDYVS